MPSGRRGRRPQSGTRSAGAGGSADRSVMVAVRVRPGSSRPRVGGRFDGPHGPALVIAVAAPAVDGRATEAARRALAAALDVRPAAVELRTGAVSRDKLFRIDDPPPDLTGRLRALWDAAGASG